MEDLHPALVSAYSTYPHKSREFSSRRRASALAPDTSYYGFPQFPDTYVTFYREDIFCNEEEARRSRRRYDATFPCSYEDWQDVDWDRFAADRRVPASRDAGETLAGRDAHRAVLRHRLPGRQGLRLLVDADQRLRLAARRRHLGRDQGARGAGRGRGQLRDVAVKAFEHYLSMLPHMPPVATTGQMDIFVMQDLFMQGKVASDHRLGRSRRAGARPQDLGRVHDKSAFGVAPGLRKEDGTHRPHRQHRRPAVRAHHLELRRGRRKEALNVVKWWLDPETQLEFAKNGGQSGLMSVMADPSLQRSASLEPRARRDDRLAEGRLARAGVLRDADPAAGGVRQGDHRSDLGRGGARTRSPSSSRSCSRTKG